METLEATKKKREKHVYSKFSDLAHMFPYQKGKVASCRNGKLENNVIYSYSFHFPIARIYEDKNGVETVFFTTDTYSSTTAQHINDVRWACNHMTLLYMKNPILVDNTEKGITWEHSYHDGNMMDFVRKINECLEKFPKQREGKEWSLRQANEQLGMLNKYIEFFGLKSHLPKAVKSCIKLVADPKWQEGIDAWKKKKKEQEAYNEEHYAEIEEKKAKERDRKFGAQILKWRNFEANRPYSEGNSYRSRVRTNGLPSLLRYNPRKERIETSQGVEVPLESAHLFYRQIKIVISRGGCVTEDACAEKILDYSVREITADHIKVGCHTIKMTECELIASQLKWNENG